MNCRVFYHDKCFDGACSASLFTRFHRECVSKDASYDYRGLAHRAGALFDESEFIGDEIALVDFKYSPSPKITWWFDHHLSPFLSPEDREHFLACQKDPACASRKFFNPDYASCTKFLADIASAKFGFDAKPMADMIYWANVVDGAQYESPEVAVEMAAPAMKLTLIIESTQDPTLIPRLIPLLTELPLEEVLSQPFVAPLLPPLLERHQEATELIRNHAEERDGTIFFDITDHPLEGFNKFIPYYLFPHATYSIGLSKSSFRIKVAVGSNPWTQNEAQKMVNLAEICERYGGGGHPRVGAISFPPDQEAAARTAAAEIVAELRASKNLHPNQESNGSGGPMQAVEGIAQTKALSVIDFGMNDYSGLPFDDELAGFLGQLLVRETNRERDFDFTFSSILAIYLDSQDRISLSFQRYLNERQVTVDSIWSRAKLESNSLLSSHSKPTLSALRNLLVEREPPTWSRSAISVMTGASALAERITPRKPAQVGIRHVMGSYIYGDHGHDEQFQKWNLEREDWGSAFVGWLGTDFRAEVDAWVILHVDRFGRGPKIEVPPEKSTPRTQDSPIPEVDSPPKAGVGPSTHVARDRWTTEDALGYFPYAYAIARFLTNPQTVSPLAISIQAPWGGGKTSMMRMIQTQLDPQHPGLKEATQALPIAEKSAGTTIGEINQELNGKKVTNAKIQANAMKQNGRLTVWFNAWKYESTNQIWAGLADAIVTQVANRLPVGQRELFYFRLHLKRLDVSKIRTRITNDLVGSLYSNFVRLAWLYLLIPALGFAVYLLTKDVVSLPWRSLSVAADLAIAVIQSFRTKIDFDKKPATITLGELVAAPNYDVNLGFVHHVTEDLRRALELVPKDHPLVIFIDDLDRCSPNKVADAVEAINLFLAGEFEHCMFVLGIDAEIVAAALNKSHGDVFAQMPSYARTTSVGWRFMDKFVQLPFIVPPPDQAQMASYANSLLVTTDRGGRVSLSAREQVAESVEKEHASNKSIQEIVQQVQSDLQLDESEREQLLRDAVTIKKMDQNIRSFNDNEQLIAERIVSSISSYSRNPRDVKRFVNSFRFYYFLRSAREARDQAVPSLDQLSRWIVLSLRWPGIIRWLRGRGLVSDESAVRDLALLETAAQRSSSVPEWVEAAQSAMHLTDQEKAWLSDEDMLSLFAAETKLPNAERLSASIGKGLW